MFLAGGSELEIEIAVQASVMSQIRQVAIPFAIAVGFEEEVVLGVEKYIQEHEPWSLLTGPERFSSSIVDLKGWPGDGVIAMIRTSQEARAARTLRIPVVDVAGARRIAVARRFASTRGRRGAWRPSTC